MSHPFSHSLGSHPLDPSSFDPIGPGHRIAGEDDLARLWWSLTGGLPPLRRRLWLTFLDDEHRTQPTVFPIDDLPGEPEERLLEPLAGIVSGLITEGLASSVPALLARPGRTSMTDQDRRWARAIREALGPATTRWPMFLATAVDLRAFAPDDLIGSG